jgi:hypothetical protein
MRDDEQKRSEGWMDGWVREQQGTGKEEIF